jgi:hypothetical protein
MKARQAPPIDKRRTAQFSAELQERARTWIPGWSFADVEGDFGLALLEIAARFNSEVTERLDRAGDKMQRGFLDWLAVRGEAARPARMPVVFKLTDAARQAVFAPAPVRLQAVAGDTPVIFETEKDVRVVPGRLDVVVGVDAAQDAFYLPPPGLSDLKPLEQLPAQWQLKSFAAAGATKLQLDPAAGLAPEMIVEAGGRQYRITAEDSGIVTIEPRLDAELQANTMVRKVVTFAPFDGITRNRQEHALYLGHMDLLNIEASAIIDVIGASTLQTGIKWQYWGKAEGSEESDWQTLEIAPPAEQKADALVLKKPKGAIEPKKIGDINSRWIRAYSTKVEGSDSFQIDALKFRINCAPTPPPCPNGGGKELSSPAAEAMANTTPLVLDNVFFPLGKEPHQFDAFYLGSEEAFSKKQADVQLCFGMADPTFYALSAAHEGAFKDLLLAGVAKDRALHLLRIDSNGAVSKYRELEALQPPMPGFNGTGQDGPAVSLDQPFRPPGISEMRSRWRPPAWAEIDQVFSAGVETAGFLVAVSAGDAIWVWHEHSYDYHKSGWISFGSIPETTPAATDDEPVSGLVYLAGDPGLNIPAKIFALRNGQLASREWPNGANWTVVPTVDSVNPNLKIRLEAIVPVLDEQSGMTTSRVEGMVGVSGAGLLYEVDENGICTKRSNTPVDFGVRPVAVIDSSGKRVIAAADPFLGQIVMFHETFVLEAVIQLAEPDAEVVGLEATSDSTNQLHFFASVVHGDLGYLVSWAPQTSNVATLSYSSAEIPAGLGAIAGAPTSISKFVVVPGNQGNSFSAEYDPSKRFEGTATILPGIVVPSSAPALGPNDLVTRIVAAAAEPHTVQNIEATKDGESLYSIDSKFSTNVGALLYYDVTPGQQGNALSNSVLELELGDEQAVADTFIWVEAGTFHKINFVDKTFTPWRVTVDTTTATLNALNPTKYAKPVPTGGRTAQFMRLDASNNNWDAALLQRVPIVFPGAVPERQPAKAFEIDGSGHPVVVVMAGDFGTDPPGPFVVDASVGAWSQNQEDTSANPELSWEYWNGKGWWKLDVTLDDTQNLKTTGAVQFQVPDDIASSDWAGKTNFWIRARLIGGDYGKEKVTVTTKPLPSPPNPAGSTEQTVDRSTEGIRPPSVLKLEISYRVCKPPKLPDYVLAQDSGSIVNQSDANTTGGAIVEAFVPLSLMLGRLSGSVATTTTTPKCPPQCECQKHTTTDPNAPVTPAPPAGPVTLETGRSLFIGLDATVSESPVNVLLLVESEHDHTAFAPMRIEALAAGHFKPIVADDATRALGESEVLSMSFAKPPTLSDLFGRSRTWLRLVPKTQGDWIPSLRGAYLNAVFAGATETLTRELVGSSDGSPNLTVRLARPPVLRDTLELRVREPLGEEERDALVKSDANLVLTDPDGLTGDWVLWKKVIDPDDQGPTERVYALDEKLGEIRFGDGIHGRIPPIGRDSIVAFKYSRTEVGSGASSTVPGNLITARTALNLVSPVESVEAVFAADQSAGGAPPESDERVLRFGFARLRHRGRVVTANDIEDLALQSSPDIAQARAVVKQGYIRLVVVMKGQKPTPNASQVRELRRLLLHAAPISLSAPNALRIDGPGIRKLRIELVLEIEKLDDAGQVSKWVKDQLATFFDSTIGGVDKDGWALGLNPTEEDIAYMLINAPHLEGITGVKLFENTGDGVQLPWPETIKPTDIVMLDEDFVSIQFETAEVAA